MLEGSVYTSLSIQIITAIIDALALQFNIPPNAQILRSLLRMELFVQLIEGAFYVWLALNIKSVQNITPKRYLDWFITTPTMLITFISLLIYFSRNGNMSGETLYTVWQNNKTTLIPILLLNALMLLFGLIGEFGIINNILAVILGFIPFLAYFYIIYKEYVADNNKPNTKAHRLYVFFFIVWSIYGIVALLPYNQKNIGYNLLDLFSKNLFGLVLSYMIYHISQSSPTMT